MVEPFIVALAVALAFLVGALLLAIWAADREEQRRS